MVKIGANPPKAGVSAGKPGDAAGAGGGAVKKSSSSSKKAAPAAAAAAASASGSERPNSVGKHTSTGASVGRASQALAAAGTNGDPTKMTCTCPHLMNHPDRADLLRKLVDVRIEVKRMCEFSILRFVF